MKKLLAILTIGLGALVITPDAEARGHHRRHHAPIRTYVAHHHHYHGPVWRERYVVYYDHYGHPVWRTRYIPIRRAHYRAPRHHHHGHGSFSVHIGGRY